MSRERRRFLLRGCYRPEPATGSALGCPLGRIEREMIYCLIPGHLADELHELLCAYFEDDQRIDVVVEGRVADRRNPSGAAIAKTRSAPVAPERRRKARRRFSSTVKAPSRLPLKARRHAQNLVFVEFAALAPSDQEDVRLMLAAQRQVAGAFDELYIRHYGVVYRRARRLVRDAHEAHDIAQQVFESLFSQLEHYQPRVDVPIRALLMTITRRTALRQHRKSRVFEALDPWEVRLKREFAADGTIDPTEPGWIADGSLLREIERLPTRQRQVLSLRFLFDLSDADIAEVLDLTPVAVRKSLHRAMKALRARLPQRETPRRAPGSDQREPLAVSRLVRFSPVLAGRRLALAG